MFCPECGETVPEGAKFCKACGAPAPAAGGSADVAADAPGDMRNDPPADQPTEPSAAPLDQTPPPPAPPAPEPPPAPIPPPSAARYPSPPPPSTWTPQGPSGPPPTGRRQGLLPGLVAAIIIVLAGLGVGLYFGLFRGSTTAETVDSTSTSVAMSTTTAPLATATTVPVTTTTSQPVTTTTQAPTTTTEDPAAVLTARVGEWMRLLESIPNSGDDLTPQIAAFLTPQDVAQARAQDLVEWWSDPGDETAVIAADPFEKVESIVFEGSDATVVCSLALQCRDGYNTRGLVSLGWALEGGQWLRKAWFDPPAPGNGATAPFAGSVLAGDLLWCPEVLHELKHLALDEGPTTPGMFMTIEFYVENRADTAVAPGGCEVIAEDSSGTLYSPSEAADKWWTGDVEARNTEIAPGEYTYVWYTFEVPEGADLRSFRYWVLLPGI